MIVPVNVGAASVKVNGAFKLTALVKVPAPPAVILAVLETVPPNEAEAAALSTTAAVAVIAPVKEPALSVKVDGADTVMEDDTRPVLAPFTVNILPLVVMVPPNVRPAAGTTVRALLPAVTNPVKVPEFRVMVLAEPREMALDTIDGPASVKVPDVRVMRLLYVPAPVRVSAALLCAVKAPLGAGPESVKPKAPVTINVPAYASNAKLRAAINVKVVVANATGPATDSTHQHKKHVSRHPIEGNGERKRGSELMTY